MYYVVEGRAKIKVADEDHVVQAGSVVYVPKNAAHRFHSIEEAFRPYPIPSFEEARLAGRETWTSIHCIS